LIDWFTVGGQVLNFIILVWLLKRFLYRPVLDAIDARERKVASELADAATTQTQAGQARDEFQRKNADFDRQRAELMRKATEDAGTESRRLLDEARLAADALGRKRQDELRREISRLIQSVGSRAQQEVFAIARKTLADLADLNLEQRMCEVFNQRLQALSGETKERLTMAVRSSAEPVLIRSAFQLPAAPQALIQRGINEAFCASVRLRFEVAPTIVSGIELVADGNKLSWSIAEYLILLENGIGELLRDNAPVTGRP